MQKVVGSSPIIRSQKAPLDGVFCCLGWNRLLLLDRVCAHSCPFKGPIEYYGLARVRASLGPRLRQYSGPRPIYGPHILEAVLFGFEEEIGAEVLAAHANGYSTTAGDLFRDLIP